jgi:phage baseplate assembly protein W
MVEYLEAIEGMGVPVVLAFQLADYTPTYSSTGLYWGFATTYTDVAGGLPTVSPKPVFAAVAALFGGAVGIAAVTATASVGAAATLARLGAATASATASVSATYLSTSLAPVFTADTPTVTASVGVAYSYTFVASGSPSPTYSLSSGSLPPGLTLNTTTGVLSGTPTGLGGVYLFEIEATNSHGSATTPAIALVVSPAQAPYLVTYSPPITPHLALPLTVGPSGSFNVVVQDTLAEVTQSVSVLLGTMKGDRTMVPDYGVDDPTFATPNAGAITQAVNQWEPRAAVAVTVNPVANNTQQGVNVQVALAAEAAS